MIYILAQGEGSRWTIDSRVPNLPSKYKQLIPINGEPNIFRTIRMLREHKRNDFIVIAEGIMFTDEQVANLPNQIQTLRVPGKILEGIFQLLKPNEPAIFLLGDVIYSRQLLADILAYDEREYTLWGRSSPNKFTGKRAKEIFALSINSTNIALVKNQLEFIKEYSTKLWSWYNNSDFSGNWEEVEDWTDDVDSPEEFNLFFGFLEIYAKRDDEQAD